MGEVIDLDALVPPSAVIRWKGKEITFNAPNVDDMLKVAQSAEKITETSEHNMGDVAAALQHLRELFWKLIPDLNGEPLSMEQLLVLVGAISDMVVPPDIKELKARGITVGADDDTKKKDEVTSAQ